MENFFSYFQKFSTKFSLTLGGKWLILANYKKQNKTKQKTKTEKVNFRSQILERPSIGEYWNISGVPVLPKNVIFTSFRTCWCHPEAYNTGTQKWSSIVQYSCTSIWDLKYTFSTKTKNLPKWKLRSVRQPPPNCCIGLQ